MHYIINVEVNGETWEMLRGPVQPGDEEYLRETVVPITRPLTDEDYMNGPAAILHNWMVRSSYVLDGDDVFWCVEWEPGLLVIRFSPDATMAWAAMRSPNPCFGGREATEEELDAYDEDAENPQYHLVFHAWDAQFEEDRRQDWQVVDETTRRRYEAALAHVNSLGERMRKQYSDPEALKRWRETCKASPIWKGEG